MPTIDLRLPVRRRKRVAGGLLAAGLSIALIAAGGAVGATPSAYANTDTLTNVVEQKPFNILLGVGANESQRIVSWYYSEDVPQTLQVEKTSDLVNGEFDPAKLVETVKVTKSLNTAADVSATSYGPKPAGSLNEIKQKGYPGAHTDGSADGVTNQPAGYINAHAVIKGLQSDTSYTYRVGPADGSHWSTAYAFKTASGSPAFDFLFFGDPQIGSSGGPALDGAGWAKTLEYATQKDPQTELLVSGGDQIEKANNEYEWTQFADSSDVLKKYSWAATIGNHDVGGKAYEQHNQVPNVLQNQDFYPGGNKTTNSGGDYWFLHKNVLFIDLNSNAYTGGSDPAHVNYVKGVIGEVGDKAKWTVLVYHHSIYSPADHANDTDNQQRRKDFTTAFSKLGVNLVLQGHDHSYSRSYSILKGRKANVNEQPAAPKVVTGPGGVIYVTSNSASGSKYYDLTAPDEDQSNYGADPLDKLDPNNPDDTLRHWANSVEDQEHVRTYTKVSVQDSGLKVSTIRSGDCSADETANPNAAVQRENVPTCGGTTGATSNIAYPTPAGTTIAPVGSLVDEFSMFKAAPESKTVLTLSTSSKVFGTAKVAKLTAKVSGGVGTLAGTVRFYDGSTLLASRPLTNGQATYSLPTKVKVGQHSLSAKFESADSTFTAPSSTSSKTKFTVTKVGTKTTVKYASKRVQATVTTKVKTSAKLTGKVRVYVDGKLRKTVSLSGGKATYKVTLKRGKHKVRAVYAGVPSFASSASKTVTVKVKR